MIGITSPENVLLVEEASDVNDNIRNNDACMDVRRSVNVSQHCIRLCLRRFQSTKTRRTLRGELKGRRIKWEGMF